MSEFDSRSEAQSARFPAIMRQIGNTIANNWHRLTGFLTSRSESNTLTLSEQDRVVIAYQLTEQAHAFWSSQEPGPVWAHFLNSPHITDRVTGTFTNGHYIRLAIGEIAMHDSSRVIVQPVAETGAELFMGMGLSLVTVSGMSPDAPKPRVLVLFVNYQADIVRAGGTLPSQDIMRYGNVLRDVGVFIEARDVEGCLTTAEYKQLLSSGGK